MYMYQSEFRFMLNQLGNGIYNPNLVWINNISERFLCICIYIYIYIYIYSGKKYIYRNNTYIYKYNTGMNNNELLSTMNY